MRFLLFGISIWFLVACSATVSTSPSSSPAASAWQTSDTQSLTSSCTSSSELNSAVANPSVIPTICNCYVKQTESQYSPTQISSNDSTIETQLQKILQTCAQASGQSVSFHALAAIREMRTLDSDPTTHFNLFKKVLKKVKPKKVAVSVVPASPTPVTPTSPAPVASSGGQGEHQGSQAEGTNTTHPEAGAIDFKPEIRDAYPSKDASDVKTTLCSDNDHQWLVYADFGSLSSDPTVSGGLKMSQPTVYFLKGKYNAFGTNDWHRYLPSSVSAKADGSNLSYNLDQKDGGAGAQLTFATDSTYKTVHAAFVPPGDSTKVQLHCKFYSATVSQEQLLDEQYTYEAVPKPVDPKVKTYTDPASGITIEIRDN